MTRARTVLKEREKEEEFLRGLRRGDRHAFETVYEAYFERIYAYLYRHLGMHADTEIVTQAVFLEIFHGLPEFSDRRSLSAWIFHWVREVLRQHLERRKVTSQASRAEKGSGQVASEIPPIAAR